MQYDLKEIERRAFRATFQDGLWDIYLGLVFMAFGIATAVRSIFGLSEGSSMIIHVGLLLVAMLMLIGGKRTITAPRLGYVRFGQPRQRKLLKAHIVLGLSVIVGIIVFAMIQGDSLGLTGLSVALAVNILIVLGAMAYFMDYDRLFGYAIVWALSLPLGLLLEKHIGLSDAPLIFILTGGLAVVVGAVLFIRFLRDYHLPPQEHLNE